MTMPAFSILSTRTAKVRRRMNGGAGDGAKNHVAGAQTRSCPAESREAPSVKLVELNFP